MELRRRCRISAEVRINGFLGRKVVRSVREKGSHFLSEVLVTFPWQGKCPPRRGAFGNCRRQGNQGV